MKQFASQLQSKLAKLQSRGVLRQYRITVTKNCGTEAGATRNEFCGGYHPITTSKNLSGAYLFQWPDGKLSKGNLTRQSLAEFDKLIAAAKSVAFTDPFGDNFPKTKTHPNIKLACESVIKTIANPTPYLTNWLQTLKKWQKSANPVGAQYIATSIGTSQTRTFSSAGFDLKTSRTSVGILSEYNETAYFTHSSLDLPDPKIIEQKKQRTEAIFGILNKSVKRKPLAGKYRVIFYPPVFQETLFGLFLANLSGAAVVNGQSKFNLKDFKNSKTVIRPDISITCDPTQDGQTGSYNFTGEGTLSKKTVFVKDGQLVTPILGAKYARKAGMAPTARISPKMDTTTIKANGIQDFDEFIKSQDKTLLIYQALGTHAQDPITGRYSLPCPYVIWIEKGEMVGNTPCTITGNFFDNLNHPETVFLTHPTEHPPGLATMANVVFI